MPYLFSFIQLENDSTRVSNNLGNVYFYFLIMKKKKKWNVKDKI